MKKYLTLFGLSWQKQLEVRSDFLFERTRALSILLSIYFLWSAVLTPQSNLLGYTRDGMLTYVLMMTVLRALVLGAVTDRIPSEIAKGTLSDILLRPISHLGYWATQDAASKSLNLISVIFEISLFTWLVSAPFLLPSELWRWAAFMAAVAGGMILYFQMSYLLGVMGFWTAQSWGPRFCFEITLEFCAGAYFPIDLLPAGLQAVLIKLPFPYLVYFPLSIFLGRATLDQVFSGLITQLFWAVALAVCVKSLWTVGLRKYGAEGR